MDNARRIAEERFARGEISEDEFQKLVSVLGRNDRPQERTQAAGPDISNRIARMKFEIFGIVGILALLTVMLDIKNDSAAGLNAAGNIFIAVLVLLIVFNVVQGARKFMRD